jgi:sugar phosphate isomerase/epimerase
MHDRADMPRRTFLKAGAVAGAAAVLASHAPAATTAASPAPATTAAATGDDPKTPRMPTRFQIACMTLPYSQFPLDRALTGLRGAGYRHVAWGTSHRQDGKSIPVLAQDAPVGAARDLATRCRDLGLEPVMMFSTIYPEAKNGFEVLRQRLLQAGAAKVPQVLTFGHTKGGNAKVWVERFGRLAPIARDNGVLLVVKQHGGETGTGEACARITREVKHDHIKVNYDAGNVMDYLAGKVNPLKDLEACRDEVRSFCIKDHRFFPPPHQDCGPGLGEIDHYRLLHLVAFTGLVMPLCCENIFAPRVPRPTTPEGVDALARRAREYLELVIQAIQAPAK